MVIPLLDEVHPVYLAGTEATGHSVQSKGVLAPGQLLISDVDPHEASLIPSPRNTKKKKF